MLRLTYGPEPLHFGELYIPHLPGPHPTVILIHGGFWRARYDLSLMTPLAEHLAAAGMAVWNIEYRRVGDAGGGWPGTLLDVAAAADVLRDLAPEYFLDLRHVAALGHSAGGHLAFWLGARRCLAGRQVLANGASNPFGGGGGKPLPLTGAISLAGVVDLRLAWRMGLSNGAVVDFLGGSPETCPERYLLASPAALVPLGIPQVLIHGSADESVPLQVSQTYAEAARAAGDPITFLELAGTDHMALVNPYSPAWARTVEIVQRLLFF